MRGWGGGDEWGGGGGEAEEERTGIEPRRVAVCAVMADS